MARERAVWDVRGSNSAITPAVDFRQGWNAIGIPTGIAELNITNETINVPAVLAAAGLDYEVVLKWEQGRYRTHTASNEELDDVGATVFDPDKGYWVYLKSAATIRLQPKVVSTVRPDEDRDPFGNYPSYEDRQVSDAPSPLGPTNQTHLVFFPGEDIQRIALGNVGGGILLWQVVWEPESAPAANWLTFSRTNGVTTIETDVIEAFLDRKNLTQGTYRGRLTLKTTAGDRVFKVVARVPAMEGEWRGRAVIGSVNGKKNPVPDVDLHLHFFEDPTIPGFLRGVIESRDAVLWPVDVPLAGHVITDDGNTFLLSGGYVLPPGDQNEPPYDRFQPSAEDVDWMNDGQFDALNPLPFPIYRAVTMQGRLVGASAQSGYSIEGRYVETVYGLLRGAIRLEGSFLLSRENAAPFASVVPALNQESTNGTSFAIYRGTNLVNGSLGTRFSQPLPVRTDLVLRDAQLELALQDVQPSQLKIELFAPNGDRATIHDRQNVSAAGFSKANFPRSRNPVTDFQSAFVAKATPTKGNWTLQIENASGVGTLKSWAIKLFGQPVFSLAGKVGDGTNQGLPAQISLAGLPYSSIALPNQEGNFTFNRLPGIPLNLTADLFGFGPSAGGETGLDSIYTRPQFLPGNPLKERLQARFQPLPVMPIPANSTPGYTNFGSSANPVVLNLHALPGTLTGPLVLAATPPSGFGPLSVILHLTGNLPSASAVSWDFGDGETAQGNELQVVQHTFARHQTNGYLVRAQVSGSSISTLVSVLPSPGDMAYALNFFAPSFSGGGTYPLSLLTSAGRTNPFAMIQHTDIASFDMDRAPYTSEANRSFVSDGFPQANVVLNPEDRDGPFQGEDSSYQNELDSFAHSLQPGVFQPYPRRGATGDAARTRYRMLCNIGAVIVPPQVSEVYPVDAPPVFTPPIDPLLLPEADATARVRGVRLVVGPLNYPWTWKE